MSDSKINFKIGTIEFTGEGDPDWVSTQLDKILNKVPELLKVVPIDKPKDSNDLLDNKSKQSEMTKAVKPSNLSVFLREKNASTNQVKKFLATSAFLQLNGKDRLTTSDITKALKEANQTKIGNPSEYLNQNVKKGHCEKDGSKEFFVTSHGFEYLGITI
jgi:hypothetical protein